MVTNIAVDMDPVGSQTIGPGRIRIQNNSIESGSGSELLTRKSVQFSQAFLQNGSSRL